MAWSKYKPPANVLQVEAKTESMKLDSKQSKDQQLLVIQRRLNSPDTLPETKIALAQLKVKLETGALSDALNDEFVNDFNMWLLGRSPYNKLEVEIDEKTGLTKIPSYDTQMGFDPNGKKKKGGAEVRKNVRKLTPWGTKPMNFLPEVQTYLSTMVDSRVEVMRYFTQLEMRQPNSLEELWMYYKYKVRGVAIDGWVVKTLRQLEPYDFIPADKIPESGSYGPGQPPIENAFGINNPVPPPGNMYQDSIYFVKSVEELVNKIGNLGLGPDEKKTLTKQEVTKLKNELDAKFGEISVGMQQTLLDMGVTSSYLYEEYIRTKGLKELETIVIGNKEKETGYSQNLGLNTSTLPRPFKNVLNNQKMNEVQNYVNEQNSGNIVMGEEDTLMRDKNEKMQVEIVEQTEEEDIKYEMDLDDLGLGLNPQKQIKPRSKKSVAAVLGLSPEEKKKIQKNVVKEGEITKDYITNTFKKMGDDILARLQFSANTYIEKGFKDMLESMKTEKAIKKAEKKMEVEKEEEDMKMKESDGEKEIKEETIAIEESEGKLESYIKSQVDTISSKVTALTTVVETQAKEFSALKKQKLQELRVVLDNASMQELAQIRAYVTEIDERLVLQDEISEEIYKARTLEEQKEEHYTILDTLSVEFAEINNAMLSFFSNTLPITNWYKGGLIDDIDNYRSKYYSTVHGIAKGVESRYGVEKAAWYAGNFLFLFDNILMDYLDDPSIPKIAGMETSEELSKNYDPNESPDVTAARSAELVKQMNSFYKQFFPSYGNDLRQDFSNNLNETQLIAGTLNNDIVTHVNAMYRTARINTGNTFTTLDIVNATNNAVGKKILADIARGNEVSPAEFALAMVSLSKEGNAPISSLAIQRVLNNDQLFKDVVNEMKKTIVYKATQMGKEGRFSSSNQIYAARKEDIRNKINSMIMNYALLLPHTIRALQQDGLKNSDNAEGDDEKIISSALGLNIDYLNLAKLFRHMDITPSVTPNTNILSSIPDEYKPLYYAMMAIYKNKFKQNAINF